jgi:hypothetical protein
MEGPTEMIEKQAAHSSVHSRRKVPSFIFKGSAMQGQPANTLRWRDYSI